MQTLLFDKSQQAIFEKARLSRDARFDGKFFVAVKTTGIYCRPVCPVRLPLQKNIEYYLTAAQASENGYRPCLRCRPELAPDYAINYLQVPMLVSALKMIEEGMLDNEPVSVLAKKIGISERHLNRLFTEHIGATPFAISQCQRLGKAKQLIDSTTMSMTEIAMFCGYRSIRQFNHHVRSVYGKSPGELRKFRQPGKDNSAAKTEVLQRKNAAMQPWTSSETDGGFQFVLHYRPPLNWAYFIRFLKVRGIPGVENVSESTYCRSFVIDGVAGIVSISPAAESRESGSPVIKMSDGKKAASYNSHALICRIWTDNAKILFKVLKQVRVLFDLDADMHLIEQSLKKDPVLAAEIKKSSGLRVPGAWDAFEIAVRAVTGQQVSVTGATTVMGRIAERYGQKLASLTDNTNLLAVANQHGIERVFASAASMAELDDTRLSMPQKRAQAIRALAGAVCTGELNLNRSFATASDKQDLLERLVAIKGIGPWTAQYIAMRVLHEPDAFLTGDLVLQKKAARLYAAADVEGENMNSERLSESELDMLAEKWRPWRSYASMIIWNADI